MNSTAKLKIQFFLFQGSYICLSKIEFHIGIYLFQIFLCDSENSMLFFFQFLIFLICSACSRHLLTHLLQIGLKILFVHFFCKEISPVILCQFLHGYCQHLFQISRIFFESRIYPGIIARINLTDDFYGIFCIFQFMQTVHPFLKLLFLNAAAHQCISHNRDLKPSQIMMKKMFQLMVKHILIGFFPDTVHTFSLTGDSAAHSLFHTESGNFHQRTFLCPKIHFLYQIQTQCIFIKIFCKCSLFDSIVKCNIFAAQKSLYIRFCFHSVIPAYCPYEIFHSVGYFHLTFFHLLTSCLKYALSNIPHACAIQTHLLFSIPPESVS